jgi:hypothetical protein
MENERLQMTDDGLPVSAVHDNRGTSRLSFVICHVETLGAV